MNSKTISKYADKSCVYTLWFCNYIHIIISNLIFLKPMETNNYDGMEFQCTRVAIGTCLSDSHTREFMKLYILCNSYHDHYQIPILTEY